MATLDLSAVLVQSPNENIATGENEFVQLDIKTDAFTQATARLVSSEQLKIN